MYDDDKISTDENKIILEQGEKGLDKHYHNGKIIVLIIAILNVIFSIIGNYIGNWNILNIIVQMGLSLALYNGVRWVWGLFTVCTFFEALFIPFTFLSYINKGITLHVGMLIWIALGYINAAVSFSLLAYNKSVSHFLNDKRTL